MLMRLSYSHILLVMGRVMDYEVQLMDDENGQ
jgi:hypothetical protein